jgi:hypothetical protein
MNKTQSRPRKSLNKTLKQKLHSFFCNRELCCENEIDKDILIRKIIWKYKKMAKSLNDEDEYLSYLNNDILIFIGYRNELEKNNDTEGVKLWDELDSRMFKNGKLSKKKIVKLLKKVPLFYLLSFLGLASYKNKKI